MLASYDKIIKYIVEKFQQALYPLQEITKNQEIIIAQNKQIIDLLATLSNSREHDTVQEDVVISETAVKPEAPIEA
ncbi:hypothetical protein [Sporomusa termitida]|uniref:Uncharacterized protein n=1 Tax=Sporomusa termitida TaxID=2377 RepID=A0A517E086_9FIRM|nr:hypothetical protein [Sporomusa termitida]QDR83012.1 hypothetical protein SPTER_44660 [Sporomusa termitida]